MKKTASFFLIALAMLHSCTDSRKEPNPKPEPANFPNVTNTKPGSSFMDTVSISFAAAVFFSPDSLQNEKIRSTTSPAIFESNTHDCYYQMNFSRTVLRKYYPSVKIVEATRARFLHFEKLQGSGETIDLDADNDPCGLVIFDGINTPKKVDMPNIETELSLYFSKQQKKGN